GALNASGGRGVGRPARTRTTLNRRCSACGRLPLYGNLSAWGIGARDGRAGRAATTGSTRIANTSAASATITSRRGASAKAAQGKHGRCHQPTEHQWGRVWS
ncbi:unnamed protein product, partial [Ectocarpus sp. 4 AP-2014]